MHHLARLGPAVLVLVGSVVACTTESTTTPTPPLETQGGEIDGGEHGTCPHATHEFSYEETETTGPQHWKDILGPDGKPKYEACGGVHDGGTIQQSPIALDPASSTASGDPFGLGTELQWSTAATVTSLWNNGHTWQAGFGGLPLALVANGGVSFALKQFHVHAPAEHAIGGKEYPLELHFVHLAPEGVMFQASPFAAVVGVMFDEDPTGADNAELAKIWDRFNACAEKEAVPVSGITLDLTKLLPSDKTYVRYDGSLTTPPCSVTVRFHILTKPILASAKQIAALTAAVGRNDRPHQPILDTTTVTLHTDPTP